MNILSCKLFNASKRKDSILASYNDPINHELVMQLNSYINQDEDSNVSEATIDSGVSEYTVDYAYTKDDIKDALQDSDTSDDVKDIEDTNSENSVGTSNSVNENTDSVDDNDGSSEDEDQPNDEESDVEQIVHSTSRSKDDEEANSTEITQSVLINASRYNFKKDVAVQTDIIMGTLNSVDDTAGVSRIQIKDNELWIYYLDSINLNTVMSDVIARLYNSGYYYLEFNRLARTDNAIVFEIVQR